jgi:hypothetical protein
MIGPWPWEYIWRGRQGWLRGPTATAPRQAPRWWVWAVRACVTGSREAAEKFVWCMIGYERLWVGFSHVRCAHHYHGATYSFVWLCPTIISTDLTFLVPKQPYPLWGCTVLRSLLLVKFVIVLGFWKGARALRMRGVWHILHFDGCARRFCTRFYGSWPAYECRTCSSVPKRLNRVLHLAHNYLDKSKYR